MLRISCAVALILAAVMPGKPSMQTATAPAPTPRTQGASPAGAPRPGLPPRDTSDTKPASGTIRGRVFAADTNAPLRRAQVLLAAGQLGVRRFATTDADGRYEFVEVAEGRYTITASKGSYVALQYGQRRAFEPGRPVALAEGQDLSQVDFALPRGSVITGRITDEFGEPLAGAFVQVQRYQYGPSGQRQLTFGGGSGLVVTNDLGEFRAYGLMPGEYVVSGMLRQPMSPQGGNPNDANEGFAPTFYPGTANAAEAELVRVELAQETSIHLTLLAGRMARVSGVVIDSVGKPLAGVRLMVRTAPGAGSMMTSNISTTGADGSFSLNNVPPGEYYLDVAGERRSDAPPEAASVPLTVVNQDITNLRVVTGPAATVSGVVVFEGDSPRRGVLSGLSVVTRSADVQNPGPMLLTFGDEGRVDEDRRFQLRGIGNVFFRAINLGPWTLKRVTLDGEDITDTPYPLRTSENVQSLRVLLTDRVADVSGAVTDARGQTVKEFVVVIQPAREMEPAILQRFLQTARPDQDGRFGARALPPGEYIATAVEVLEQGREWDPDYRPRLRDAGRRFSIKEGESVDLDLKLASGV